MLLFDEEMINISKIHTIAMFDDSLENKTGITHYSASLPTYELIYFISGESMTIFNGVKLHRQESCLNFLPKGAKDGEYSVKRISGGLCIDIYFDTPDKMPDFAFEIKKIPELKNLFVKIYNIWSSKKSGYYLDCMTVFFEIIRTIRNHNKKYFSNQHADKIYASYEYMLSNFKNTNFDYNEMCQRSGLSYSYFKELFISKYKISPVKYLTHLRIEYAKELLVTERYTITEIAELCGFENVYYFSSVFKKLVGVPPSRFK